MSVCLCVCMSDVFVFSCMWYSLFKISYNNQIYIGVIGEQRLLTKSINKSSLVPIQLRKESTFVGFIWYFSLICANGTLQKMASS